MHRNNICLSLIFSYLSEPVETGLLPKVGKIFGLTKIHFMPRFCRKVLIYRVRKFSICGIRAGPKFDDVIGCHMECLEVKNLFSYAQNLGVVTQIEGIKLSLFLYLK